MPVVSRDGYPDGALRIALLAYRGNPHCGGQGVYTRYLARALTALGHKVEVFAGQPYPELDAGVRLTPVPSLDLYRADDPFRRPHPREFRDWIDILEYGLMCSAGFPEPLTFSLRVRRLLLARRQEFDIIHDNQCLGSGLLDLPPAGLPLVATIHHPIAVDREVELAHARTPWRKLTTWRWYGFTRMQVRVARKLPRILTVSESSRVDIATKMSIPLDRVVVVPVGVDHDVFRPHPSIARVPGRILAMASAEVALKGVVPLLHAFAEVRRQRDAELVLVTRPKYRSQLPATVRRLGLEESVRLVSGIEDADLLRLYHEAEVAVVPSLYEGFSLPAVQAMAAGVPLVATTAGALSEVVGQDGETALLVPPGDVPALARGLLRLLGDGDLRDRLQRAARERALERYSWTATAEQSVAQYREVLHVENGLRPARAAVAGTPAC